MDKDLDGEEDEEEKDENALTDEVDGCSGNGVEEAVVWESNERKRRGGGKKG